MLKKILFVLGGLAVAFVVGYLPQSLNVGRLTDELEESSDRYESQVGELEQENRILELQRDLGMLLLEVEDQNYGRARNRSTAWFDQLGEAIASTSEEEVRRALTGLSGRRDALTMLLTEASEDAVTQIRDMYRILARLTRTE